MMIKDYVSDRVYDGFRIPSPVLVRQMRMVYYMRMAGKMSDVFHSRVWLRDAFHKFGPIEEGHELLEGLCPACQQHFKVGDILTLVPVGPGDDVEAQARAREGRPFNAVALPTHWTCATGLGNDAPDLVENSV